MLMSEAKLKKFFVPCRIFNCLGNLEHSEGDPKLFRQVLQLVSLRPPNDCCGFIAFYPSRDEMQSHHPQTSYIETDIPIGGAMPAVIYRSRQTFPKEALAFMLAYGTLEALRWQFPDDSSWHVFLPWPENGQTDTLSGAGDSPSEGPEASLDNLNQPPRWRN